MTSKLLSFLFWAGVTYLVLILIFIFKGGVHLEFGHEIADLLYVFLMVCSIVSLITIKLLSAGLSTNARRKANLMMFLVLFISITFFTYKITYGRGPQFPWNGKIFITPPSENG